MKKYLLLVLTVFTFTSVFSTDFRSKRSGAFEDKTNWTPSSRVPGPGDNVTIQDGDDITISSAITVASLTIDDKNGGSTNTTLLTINPTGNLTVTGDVTMLTNNPRSFTSPDYSNVAYTQMWLYGTLTVGGDFTMSNSSYITSLLGLLTTEYIGSNQIILGNPTNPGTLTVNGDLNLSTESSFDQLPQNNFAITHGTVTFGGMLNLTCNEASGQALDNFLFFYDQGGYSGLQKDVFFTKTGNPFNLQQGMLNTQSSSDFSNTIWHFTANNQALIVSDLFTFGIISIESPKVTLGSNLNESHVGGKVLVTNGSTLVIDNANANLSGLTTANKVELEAGGTLRLKDAGIANGLPANGVLNANPNSFVDFEVSNNQNYDVLSASGTYPKVTMSGKGTKTISSSTPDIDNGSFRVGEVQVNEGTLVLEDGVMLHLNNSYGTKRFQLDSATTLKIEGIADVDAFADISRYNTTDFSSSFTQNLFVLTNDAAQTEPYGILKLSSGNGAAQNKNLSGGEVLVENRLTLGNNVNLNLNNNGFIHLLSDAQFTAYVAEIPASASINHSGTGNFIVDKYFATPGYAAPDLTHPIQGATLANYNNQGFQMRGFPGSNKPGNRFASVSTYTESALGGVNTGFNKPSSINDAFIVKDASGKITRSTYRANVDPVTTTLSDTGAINTGDHVFKITFNFSNTGDNSRLENDGFNLIGNPFPANLDWKKVVNDPANKALFDNGFIVPYVYVYKYFDRVEQEPTGTSGYGYFNPITNFQYAQDSIIPSHQGFWVKAFHPTSSSETYELIIRESHKVNFEGSRNYKAKAKNTKDLAAKISLESDGRIDEIFFHTWPKATIFFDKKLDISSYGAKNESQAHLDFIDFLGKPMDLYVNAVDQDLRGDTLPIYVNITKAGTHLLKISNLNSILNDYACSYIIDKVTGTKTNLSNVTNYSFTSDAYKGVRFVIYFSKRLSDKVVEQDITCHDANDGKVDLDLSPIDHNSFTLFYEGSLLKSFVGYYENISASNLKPGSYELVNNNGLLTCTSNKYVFEIENPAALTATIEKSIDDIFVNDRVRFTAGGNASVYNWTLNGANYPGDVFEYTFPAKGTYTLNLQFADAALNCPDEMSEEIIVQELATGITAIAKNDKISIANGQLVLANDAGYTKAFVYSLNGQLLNQLSLNPSAVNTVEIPQGATIIEFIGQNGLKAVVKVGR